MRGRWKTGADQSLFPFESACTAVDDDNRLAHRLWSWELSGYLSRCWKTLITGCSKRSRCEAREESTSGGVFTDTLERGDW